MCSHAGGVKGAACNLLAELRSAENEETWVTLVAKLPSEDNAAESAVAAEASNAVECHRGGKWKCPPRRPDDEYASEVLFDVIGSRSALSGPGNID